MMEIDSIMIAVPMAVGFLDEEMVCLRVTRSAMMAMIFQLMTAMTVF